MSSPVLENVQSPDDEVSALIATLAETELRLEQLTRGEVDTVAGRDGRTFVLRHAQEQLRRSEISKQAAILNALPAHVALLDAQGEIISVNESWRRFALANSLHGVSYGVGLNYLSICDQARGPNAAEASIVAAGIRTVLSGEDGNFSIEYPCHAPGEQRWFVMTVTPLSDEQPSGVVVMHLDITDRKRATELVRASEREQRELATKLESERMRLVAAQAVANVGSWETNLLTLQVEWSEETHRIFGTDHRTFPPTHEGFIKLVHSDDRARVEAAFRDSFRKHEVCTVDHQIQLRDGSIKFVEERWQVHHDQNRTPVRAVGTCQDITERKRASTLLVESQRRLALATKSANVGIWDWDVTENKMVWDAQMFALYGRENGEIANGYDKWSEAVHPDDRARGENDIADALAGTRNFDTEFRIRWPNGEVHYIEAHAVVERNASGSATRMIGTNRDITERKLAEKALRASEAEFRTLAEAMPQMVWILGPDGSNIYSNQQWTGYTGLSLKDSLGKGWAERVHPDDRTRHWAVRGRAIENGIPYSVEHRIRRADGEYRWWLVRGVPLRDAAGAVVKWFGSCTDIHDLKVAELEITRTNLALRESETRFRQLAEGIDQVFWLFDPVTHRVLYVSPAYEKIWGRKEADLLLRSEDWLEGVHKGDRTRVAETFAATATGASYNETFRVIRPDGNERWVHHRGFPVFDSQNGLVSIAALAEDITEQRKLQSQFLRAQRMESIGSLAGGIAHDLNNVLSPILMAVELLKQEPVSSRGIRLLETVHASALRGAGMVKQVLMFARGVDGERREINPKHLLQEIERIAFETFPKNVTIDLNVTKECGTVLGDITQLQQVLLNLCVNARDAMPNGGILRLFASNAMIDASYAAANPGAEIGPHVVLEVEDTGAGIPQEILAKIFDPFFTTKPLGQGTGLGLSTLQVIVKSHAGFVQVQSEVGRGSTFRIFLPSGAHPREHTAQPFKIELPRGKGELVLVVDDEVSIRHVTQSTMEAYGYRVLVAQDGAEAIALFSLHRSEISVVIMDMMMPIFDGAAAIIAIHSIDPRAHIIATSGLISVSSLDPRISGLVQFHLQKPYTAEKLLTTVREALASPRMETGKA